MRRGVVRVVTALRYAPDVAGLNSIPDWLRFFVPWMIAATANWSVSSISKRYRKGRVISMKLRVAIRSWWASAFAVGTAVLAGAAESG